MLFSIILSLLAAVPSTQGSKGHNALSPYGMGKAFNAHARRENSHRHNMKLVTRQASPPITTDPDCALYDGYFYTTPLNYTWQLQCSNSYSGTVVAQTTDTTDLGSCITECANYNRDNAPGACVAVTFSGSYSGSDTVCTQYSSVDEVYLASEEGGVVNSALLILGPGGEIFATPQADPTFPGAPTQPSDVDPLPSQTTTSIEITPTSTLFLTTSLPSVVTLYAAFTTTTTSTSTILVTSCLLGQPCQPNTTPTSSSSSPTSTTSTSSLSVSDGGSGSITLSTTTTSMQLVPESTTSGAITLDAEQTTFTTIVPFTEYRIQTIEICAATPTPCSQSLSTATSVMYLTEISCSPGACIGVVPTTGYLVDAIATGTCIII
ncbi:hypothetical protein, variant 2 [Phialophora macrospora]|uniref:Apple domain-containing protein n=1 Tax=Phialophora macrospora TaxID=1851006 RepID=A0A0D2G2E9_9EURO|nr:hypothetical protein PV04_01108 [Phialophora macrospora]KIW72951.1 hypothetical protein, variant 1 [Phialophora macrospora]KIW72952.1 hypothetical protein, variant 2 [Phialophora macrospora]